MSDSSLSLEELAVALRGDIRGSEVLVPGPGHSADDRSLRVRPNLNADGGFVVHSFAGDDPLECRDYVRTKLGLPAFEKKANAKAGGVWKLVREHIYYTADGKPLLRKRKMLDSDGKRQFPQQHWNGNQWVNGVPKDWPRVLYRLRELVEASVTAPAYITEGEGDSDALTSLHLVATTAGGVNSTWTPEMIQYFRGRPVVIFTDADEPGRKYAATLAGLLYPVAKSVKVVDLYPSRSDGSDVSKFLETDRAGIKLLQVVNASPLWEPKSEDDKRDETDDPDELLIAELAALPRLQYERRREQAAEQLGIRVSVLDKLVEGQCESKTDATSEPTIPLLYEYWAVEPTAEPVDGGSLLRSLKEAIQNFVFVTDEQATVVTLWIVFVLASRT
jgi:hypothetical protein